MKLKIKDIRTISDFLVTEDYGLHKKANRIDLDDRVLSIASALDYFKNLYARIVPKHALLKEEYVRNLDVDDPFFDLLTHLRHYEFKPLSVDRTIFKICSTHS